MKKLVLAICTIGLLFLLSGCGTPALQSIGCLGTMTLTKGESAPLALQYQFDSELEEEAHNAAVAGLTPVIESSNEAVVRLDNGVLCAVEGGSATITAKVGSISAECLVTVVVPVERVRVPVDVLSLMLNGENTADLGVTVEPANATDSAIEYSTSDPAIATVEGGRVRAISNGTCTITATAGGKSAHVSVTVTTAPESIELDEKTGLLYVGRTHVLTPRILPAEAAQDFEAMSDNTSVCSVVVDEDNGTVTLTAVGVGTANITVSTGDVSATYVLTVTAAPAPSTPSSGQGHNGNGGTPSGADTPSGGSPAPEAPPPAQPDQTPPQPPPPADEPLPYDPVTPGDGTNGGDVGGD